MTPFVNFVRWFNNRTPLHKFKPKLSKRADAKIATREDQIFDGILDNLRLRLDMSVYYHRQIYLNNYEPVVMALVRRLLRPKDVVIDGGANIGLITLLAARRVGPQGKVYALEPEPATLKRLHENIELNNTPQVQVIPKGCWDESKSASLYSFANDEFATTSMTNRPEKDLAQQVEIETVRIDDVVTEPVRLMKLDVEGAEFAALRGAEQVLQRSQPHLLIELNAETSQLMGYSPIDMVDWILERWPSYRLHLVRSRRIRPMTRDALAKGLEKGSIGVRNLWFDRGD